MKYFNKYPFAAMCCPISRIRRIRPMLTDTHHRRDFMRSLQDTLDWCHDFWHKNNIHFDKFMNEREGIVSKETLYREYLMSRQQELRAFNREWLLRNLQLTWLDLRARYLYFKSIIRIK